MKLRRLIRKFQQSQRGAATLEFVVTFPILFLLVLLSINLSFTLVQATLLDRALDLTVRDLRLGNLTNPAMTALEQAICDRMVILGDCEASLTLEFTRVDPQTFTMPPQMGPCTARDPQAEAARAGQSYDTGAENDLMLVRACVEVTDIVARVGNMRLYARSAYVVEPD